MMKPVAYFVSAGHPIAGGQQMTRDEILQMEEQFDFDWSSIGIDALETFYNLIAAIENEAGANVCDDIYSEFLVKAIRARVEKSDTPS